MGVTDEEGRTPSPSGDIASRAPERVGVDNLNAFPDAIFLS